MTALKTIKCTLAALLFLPALGSAQELPVLPRAPLSCRFDSTAVRDSIDFTLFLTPPPSVPKARKERERYAPYIQAIASTFVQPHRLAISYWPGSWADEKIERKSSVGDCDGWCQVGPMEGEVEFRLADGSLPAVSWPLEPDSREVMGAMERAIHEADSLHLLPQGPRFAGLRPGTVRLAVRLARWPPAIGGVPVGRVRLPHVRRTRNVEVLYQPYPHFPGTAAEFESYGPVSLQYIVGEDGLVPEETIRVLEAAHPTLVPPSVRAILGSRFRPAEAGGCPIRQMVHQRVVFRR